VTDPAGAQTYTDDYAYDAVGNRQTKTHAAEGRGAAVTTDYMHTRRTSL